MHVRVRGFSAKACPLRHAQRDEIDGDARLRGALRFT
jgi:hypothetical protein